jgi:uncharacterized membrane protein YfcA
MRTEYKLFVALGIFMLPLGIIYWFVSYEIAGSIMLLIVAIAFAFIGVYLAIQSKRMAGFRPEDYDATQEEGVGVVGSFPGSSIWPLISAIALTFIAFGLTFSSFLAIPGLGLLLATVIGMARESEIAELHHEDIDAHNHQGVTPAPNFSDQIKK